MKLKNNSHTCQIKSWDSCFANSVVSAQIFFFKVRVTDSAILIYLRIFQSQSISTNCIQPSIKSYSLPFVFWIRERMKDLMHA